MSKPKIGKIYFTNDSKFTKFDKRRRVVVSKFNNNKKVYGVSRILSLDGKKHKVEKGYLMPLQDEYKSIPKKSGVDSEVYFKDRRNRKLLNFDNMDDLNESLTDIDCRKMVGHIQRHYRGKKR